jgi:DNA-binding CsgD family transcriptional regulator
MEKRINLLFISFSLIVSLANSWYYIEDQGLTINLFTKSEIIVPLVGTIYFTLLQFLGGGLLKASQIIFLFGISSTAIIDKPDSIYGLGFMLIAVYLLYKYNYLRKNFLTKGLVIILFIFVLIFTSFFGNAHFSASVNTMAFVFFFFVAFFLGEWQWIQTLRKKDKEYKESIKTIYGEQVDLESLNFTKRELEVGRLIIHYQETDKELAWRMKISPDTFRNHLKSMRKKAGVSTKQQLIEKMRWYYSSREGQSDDAPEDDNLRKNELGRRRQASESNQVE